MTLKQQIEAGIKQAMKAKATDELRTLRSIKSLILLAETEKGGKQELGTDRELQLLTKAAKQRKDSAAVFSEQGREDLYEKEMAELKIIQRFLPEQLSEDAITKALQGIIDETGASSMRDMGKVMGLATKKLAGKADGKVISKIVKSLLS